MNQNSDVEKESFNLMLFITDAILFVLSVIISYILRTSRIDSLSVYKNSVFFFIPLSIIVKSLTMILLKNYYFSFFNFFVKPFYKVIIASIISSICISIVMIGLLRFGVITAFPRSVLIIDFFVTIFSTFGTRYGLIIYSNSGKKIEKSTGLIHSIQIFLQKLLTDYSGILMVIFVVLYGILYFLFGKVISVGNGFGWDGQIYRDISKNFNLELFLSKSLNSYAIQRIVPSGLVSFVFHLLNIPLSDNNILVGFQILNLIILLISIITYLGISNFLKFSTQKKWIGFFGLFVNFLVVKQFFYYPTLTDSMAFMLGLLLIYFYFRNWAFGILFITLVGAFTWPTFMYFSLLLFIFPSNKVQKFETSKKMSIILSAFVTIALLTSYIWFYYIQKLNSMRTIPISEKYLVISMISSLLYIFLAVYPLINNFGIPIIRKIWKTTSILRITIATSFFLGIKYIIEQFSSSEQSHHYVSNIYYIQQTIMSALVRPLNFLLAHIIFFGPIIFLTIYFWNKVSKLIKDLGIGVLAFVGINLIMSLNSESRQLATAFPIFVIFTIKAIQNVRFKYWFYWIFVVTSLILSSVWLPLGNVKLIEGYFKFPFQWYFMHYGPWMSNQMYIVQGIFVIVIGVIFYYFIYQKENGGKKTY